MPTGTAGPDTSRPNRCTTTGTSGLFEPVPLGAETVIANDTVLRLHRAGHILRSSWVHLTLEDGHTLTVAVIWAAPCIPCSARPARSLVPISC